MEMIQGKGMSQQDDPWSSGDKKSPPDLDEFFGQLGKKFSRRFGQPDGSGTSVTPSGVPIKLILAILFIVWFLSGFFIIDSAEKSAILRFGRYVETVGPGLHWMPRFIESQYTVNVRHVNNFHYNDLMLTKDENIVSVEMAVQYRTDDPKKFLFNITNPIESLQQATASALRQVIGHTTLDDILTIGREAVRDQVSAQLTEILGLYQAGIKITDVAMQPAKPPEEVTTAFDDAIKAREDEQRYINEARAYEMKVVPRAKGRAARYVQAAEAEKRTLVLRSTGEIAQFLALLPEFQRSPEATKERLYFEMMENVLSNVSKVFLDNPGGHNMVYLPIDQMFKARHGAQENHSIEPNEMLKMSGQSQLNKANVFYQREGYTNAG